MANRPYIDEDGVENLPLPDVSLRAGDITVFSSGDDFDHAIDGVFLIKKTVSAKRLRMIEQISAREADLLYRTTARGLFLGYLLQNGIIENVKYSGVFMGSGGRGIRLTAVQGLEFRLWPEQIIGQL